MSDSGDSGNCGYVPHHFTLMWTTENVGFLCEALSPRFSVKEMEMTNWILEISNRASDFLQLKVYRKGEDGPASIEIKFEISILGVNGSPLIEKEGVKKFAKDDVFEFAEFANNREVCFGRRAEFLPKDALTVRCRMWRTGTEISRGDWCFARTRLTPDRRSFFWVVREFRNLQRDQEKKLILKITSTYRLTFKLIVTEKEEKEYVSIAVQDCCKFSVVQLSLLDGEGKVVHSREQTGDIGDDIRFDCFFEKSKLLEGRKSLLPDDVLTLRCEIEMPPQTVWSKIESYRYVDPVHSVRNTATVEDEILCCEEDETSNSTSNFADAMKCLVEGGFLSDVCLRTDSKSFPAHKCVLSARSPVFRDMFGEDTKEQTSNCIEITDVNEDTLKELLSYIYTDTLGKLECEGAVELYKAADKYKLPDLQRRCAIFLKSNISRRSVCSIFSVADEHHDQELRNAAQDFVMNLGLDFFTTDTWQSFKNENSKLSLEITEPILLNYMGQ